MDAQHEHKPFDKSAKGKSKNHPNKYNTDKHPETGRRGVARKRG